MKFEGKPETDYIVQQPEELALEKLFFGGLFNILDCKETLLIC